jgi:hypothetical protein
LGIIRDPYIHSVGEIPELLNVKEGGVTTVLKELMGY